MHLGIRGIRSAGRTSGSIEITLPSRLQVLEGIDCRMTLRDGGQPEIILQPDLSAPHHLIKDLWQKVRLSMGDVGDVGEFNPADFTMMLFQPDHWQERPPLVYADALRVLTHREGASENLISLIAALAIGAAHRLDLTGALATAFADALTYMATGGTSGLGADFERGMAYQMLESEPDARRMATSPLNEQTWLALRPVVRRVFEQFLQWRQDPAAYAAARESWYRVFTAEVALSMSPAIVSIEQTSSLTYINGRP